MKSNKLCLQSCIALIRYASQMSKNTLPHSVLNRFSVPNCDALFGKSILENKPMPLFLTQLHLHEQNEPPPPDIAIRPVANHPMLSSHRREFTYHYEQLLAVQHDGRAYRFRLYGRERTKFTNTVTRVQSASPGVPARVFFRSHTPVLLRDIAEITVSTSLSHSPQEHSDPE